MVVEMNFNFIRYSKVYFIFSGILVLGSLSAVFYSGLNPGTEFTGGSIVEVQYTTGRPSEQSVRELLSGLDLGEFVLQPSEETGLILRMKEISEQTHQLLLEKLREKGGELEELRFESIGPIIGQELRDKTRIIVILSILAIVLYIAFSFRRLTFPIRSWQYGLATLLALLHDVLIPLGLFAVLGTQITIPVVVALLTVLGYSVNNTVVVFDRIRENLVKRVGVDYQDTVNRSIEQSLFRTLSTALTTIFVLTAIYFFGGETLKYFALALIIGIGAGTWSSIFLAGPTLVAWQGRAKRH